jgi:hypothetical protein
MRAEREEEEESVQEEKRPSNFQITSRFPRDSPQEKIRTQITDK